MRLLRLLLACLVSSGGLVLFTQTPAEACSCAVGSPAQHVEWADVVFHGTLVETDQTNPGDPDVISSSDPALYTFEVARTLEGDAGDGVVESARFGASCGLEGMRVGQDYVVFADETKDGDPAGLTASLCGGTAPATPRLLARVAAAVSEVSTMPTTAPTPEPSPSGEPVPSTVPSGVAGAEPDEGPAAWMWFGGGVLGALLGVAAATLVTRTRAAAGS